MFVAELPRKLRFSVVSVDTGHPVAFLLLDCAVELRLELRFTPRRGSPVERSLQWTVGLPPVATDHVGYASLPLASIARLERGLLEVRDRVMAGGLAVDIFRVSVVAVTARAPSAPAFRADFTDALQRFVTGALPYPLQPEEQVIVVPAAGDIRGGTHPVLPAIVEPDVQDWRLSPASFGMTALPTIGEDGCQTLLPSYETERVVRFSQILRSPTTDNPMLRPLSGKGPGLAYRPARLIEYETVWHPLNHALGKVLYSLTLAPCEAANVATLDWKRSDAGAREETTRATEQLLHEQRRDRTVEEVLEAMVSEWQKGEAFQGGTAGVGGYGGQGNGSMWGVTGSHAIGWGTSSSEGNREVEAANVQRLGDTVAQSSRMVRELRSTVVVQATQAETETVQTRTVRNHNHSHALTLLYYEVVRHYVVTTRAVREREIVMVRFPRFAFTRELARRHSRVLRARLLDPGLAAAFDGLSETGRDSDRLRRLIEEGSPQRLLVRVWMGDIEGAQGFLERSRMRLLVMTHDGAVHSMDFERGNLDHFEGDRPYHEAPDPRFPNIITAQFKLAGTALPEMHLSDISEIGLSFNVFADIDTDDHWHQVEFRKLTVSAVTTAGTDTRMVELLSAEPVVYFRQDSEWWAAPNRLPSFAASDAREHLVERLIEHLNAHAAHYSRVLWLASDGADLLAWFERVGYPPDRPRGSLADFADSAPIGVRGDYLAFAVGDYRRIPADAVPEDERVVSLPTRGSFAEVQLSHCNASEFIDNRRFWDWQQSPCNDQPPAIGNVSLGSRYQNALNTAPTTLGEPAVGIRDPAEAPPPSTLGVLLDSVMRADVFRDMSGRAELAGILTELTRAAAEVEQKRMDSLVKLAEADAEVEQARLGAERGSGGSAGGGSSGGGAGGGSGGGVAPPAAAPVTGGTGGGAPMPPTPIVDGGTGADGDSDGDTDTGGGGGPRPRPTPTPTPEPPPAPEIELLVEFRDSHRGSLVGTHYVKAYYTERESGLQRFVERRVTHGAIVRLNVPAAIRPNIVLQTWSYGASLPDWRNLDALRRLLTGALPALPTTSFSFDPPIHGEDTLTIDPASPSTLRIALRLDEMEQEVRVRGEVQLQHTIESVLSGSLEVGLGWIEAALADATATGSISETIGSIFGVETEVETTVRLSFLRNRFLPAVQGGVGSS